MKKKSNNTGKKQDTKFKKGQSGNPNGRPKGSISITSAIKRKLNQIPKGEKRKWVEKMVETIMDEGVIKRNEKLLRLIWNYVDGMPKQKLEHTGEGGEPIQVNVVSYKK